MNPMNHLDAALARSARRVEEARKANHIQDPVRFMRDDHWPDGTVKRTPKPPPKPPLGAVPHTLWVEGRLDDLAQAIARYREAGFEPLPEWEAEITALHAADEEQTATSYLYTFVNGLGEESAPSPVSATVLRPDGVSGYDLGTNPPQGLAPR